MRLSMPRPGWKSAGVLALLCSGVAWASLPHIGAGVNEDQRQWQAIGIAPLSSGGATGMQMAQHRMGASERDIEATATGRVGHRLRQMRFAHAY